MFGSETFCFFRADLEGSWEPKKLYWRLDQIYIGFVEEWLCFSLASFQMLKLINHI